MFMHYTKRCKRLSAGNRMLMSIYDVTVAGIVNAVAYLQFLA